MIFLWMLLYSSNPIFFLLGYSGALGKDAEKAAEELAAGLVLLIGLCVIAVGAVYVWTLICENLSSL